MRNVVTGIVAILVVLAAGRAGAIEYPWCAEYSGRGGGNCGFSTYEQCRASVSGVGGLCRENPFYLYQAPTPGKREPVRGKKRQQVEQ